MNERISRSKPPVHLLMPANMIYLFTTPSCPYCPQAKKLLEEKAYRFESIDASKPVGLSMAKRFQISQVPSLLITDSEGNKTRLHSGIESISFMLQNE